MDVRFSITIRQHKSLRNLIEAIPEDAWTPIPYWMDTTCPHTYEPNARLLHALTPMSLMMQCRQNDRGVPIDASF